MKLKSLLVCSASLALALHATAATITVGTTGSGTVVQAGTARAVYDLNGNAIADGAGFAAVGYFNGVLPNFASATAEDVTNSFVILGTPGVGLFGVDVGGGNIADGLFNYSASAPIAGDTPGPVSPFVGQNAYLIIGDGNSISNSNGIAVFDGGFAFAADNPLFTENFDLQTGETQVFGGAFDGTTSGPLLSGFTFTGASNSYQIAALVPEPSSSLLALLGGVALLRRRRA